MKKSDILKALAEMSQHDEERTKEYMETADRLHIRVTNEAEDDKIVMDEKNQGSAFILSDDGELVTVFMHGAFTAEFVHRILYTLKKNCSHAYDLVIGLEMITMMANMEDESEDGE